jgi:hypothetical protein
VKLTGGLVPSDTSTRIDHSGNGFVVSEFCVTSLEYQVGAGSVGSLKVPPSGPETTLHE